MLESALARWADTVPDVRALSFIGDDYVSENPNILLLTADTGACHQSVSQAIKERFEKALPNHTLKLVDAYNDLLEFPLSFINTAHRQIVRRSPGLWNLLFESTSSGKRFSRIESFARPLAVDRVEEIFDEFDPVAVVSVVPLVNGLVGEVALRRGVPFIVMVTDMARIHPAWIAENPSLFCVTTQFAKDELVRLGVAEEKVFMTGLPTRRQFFRTEVFDKRALRAKLGIRQESFAVLMMGGGEGVGLSAKAVKELSVLGNVELYIFTGRNARLKKKIERRYGNSVKALSFVSNVDEWLKAADLLITKSGPSTLVEAAASQIPTLFIGALPGQEQSIIDYLIRASAGGEDMLCNEASISARVAELISSDQKRRDLVDSLTNFATPSASAEVCSLIGNLVTPKEEGARTYV